MNRARKYSSERIKGIQKRISDIDRQIEFNQMNLALNISKYMKARGFNNTTFAEATKKNVSEITRWLSGTHNFTMNILTEVCCVLGISLEKLFQFEKPQVSTSATITVKTSVVHDDDKSKQLDFPSSVITGLFKNDSLYNKDLIGKS